MQFKEADMPVGYSVFDFVEECYEYNENACFIADTRASAVSFRRAADLRASECRIDLIRFRDIMMDYGAAGGEYAMEPEAYRRFTRLARLNDVQFEVEPYNGDDSLMVVIVDGVELNG